MKIGPEHEARPAVRPAGLERRASGSAHPRGRFPGSEARLWLLVLGAAVLLWAPRYAGPIDLRWDGGVYYILGTSLSEGRGYKLLSEPGAIEAVQYPPFLPAIVAAHQWLLGTSDPTTVGRWLRLSSFLVFIAYASVVLRFLRSRLPPREALLGALLSLFCLHAWFLSDLLFPEIWFAVATLLFLMFARDGSPRSHVWLAYVCAVASYALRTVGIVAFAAWVLDSVLRRRFKEAVFRAVLALIPVVAWQFHVASVENSQAYAQPAYEYQRAPYLFYNVSYARNVVLMDPFTPEEGQVRIGRRLLENAATMPPRLAETLSAPRGYYYIGLQALLGTGPRAWKVIDWTVFLLLTGGGLLVAAGFAVQLIRRQWLVPLYALLYMTALCLTPFPGQYLRYLMPLAPLLALSALLFLNALAALPRAAPSGRWSWATAPSVVMLGPALLIAMTTAAYVYAREHQPIEYRDVRGARVVHPMFFYNEAARGFDEAIDYVRGHNRPTDVVAAGTPHWIYLRTGLKVVMPPFEQDAAEAQRLLDTVPVHYLIVGRDVVGTERYTAPVVQRFPDRWAPVFSTGGGHWTVYRRTGL